MKKITVIIPLYNSEKSINKTLNSLLSQSFTDLEILIINDGSTDNSLSVISNFKDDRIRVISQNNSGAVSAYVNGIKNAETEYIMFCDSDDFYKPNFINDAYKRITSENVDVVSYKMSYVTPQMEFIKESKYGIKPGRYSRTEIESLILPKITFNSFKNGLTHIIPVNRVTKICKKDLLLKFINDFDLSIKQLEDNVFTTLLLLNAESIYIDEKAVYDYVQQEVSVSTGYRPNLFSEYEKSVLYLKELLSKYSFYIEPSQFTKLIFASTRVVLRRIAKSTNFKTFKKDFTDIVSTQYLKEIKINEIDDKINLLFLILLRIKFSLITYIVLRKIF